MKKYFEVGPNFDDLKSRMVVLRDKEDNKTTFIVIAIATLLAVVALGAVYLLKTKMDNECDVEWDYDWDDLEDEFSTEEDCVCSDKDCCCTDKDVDKSVKVEQI